MENPAKRKAVGMQDGASPRPLPFGEYNSLVKKNEQLRHENEQLKDFIKSFLIGEGTFDSRILPEEFQSEIEQVERKFVIDHILQDGRYDWSGLSQKWKDDVEVACAMYELGDRVKCQNRPRWRELPYHLRTNEQVLVGALKSWNGPVWSKVPWWMKDNPNVMLAAYISLGLSDLPELVKRRNRKVALHFIKKGTITVDECTCFNETILRDLVEKGELDWSMLPHKLKTSLRFAMTLSKFPFPTCATSVGKIQREILLHVRDAREDPSFWRHFFVLSKDVGGVGRWVNEFLPPYLLSDMDFMLDICSEFEYVLALQPHLLSDIVFVQKLLARNIWALHFVPYETQESFPEMIQDLIPSLRQHDQVLLTGPVSLSLFEDRAFALAWFSAGLGRSFSDDYLDDSYSRYKGDEEITLAFLEHSPFDCSSDVSPALLEDRDFVLKAVRVHPWLFHRVNPQLQSDHFVFTKFAAQSYEITKEVVVDMHLRGDDAAIEEYLGFIRSERNKYDGFFEFVRGATIKRSDRGLLKLKQGPDSDCPLLKLNQGPDTFLKFKKRLAEFLQVPTGEWLQDLRRAEHHVSKSIQPWTPITMMLSP